VAHHEAHGSEGLSGISPQGEPDAPEGGPEAGRLLFAKPSHFIAAAGTLTALPPGNLPEVAFAGRSNVGKSSLVNALTGRKSLARTSATPGCTRTVNLFDLGGRLVLADLPGYGYARSPKEQVAAWTGLVEDYLRGRPVLRRVLLLVDARRGPMDSDRAVMALLDSAAVNFQVVLTKTDSIKPAALAGLVARTGEELRKHPAAHPDVVVSSARTGAGIEDIRASLAALAVAAHID
jgi:GTP-binding protein